MSYVHLLKKLLPQTSPLPGQVQNNSGGYGYEITPWARLARFLVLGSDAGTYYQSAEQLTAENANVVSECASLDAPRTATQIAESSERGAGASNSPAIFALALMVSHPQKEVRSAAALVFPRVVRTGAHILEFTQTVRRLRGFGRQVRRIIAQFYATQSVDSLMYQLVKYRQRGGMSQRDVFRLVHPLAPPDRVHVYTYVAAKDTPQTLELPEYLLAFEELQQADEARTIQLIERYRFTHEMISTRHKRSGPVWEALLVDMPMTAMIRNLAQLSSLGLLSPMAEAERFVLSRLGDTERLRRARVHPLSVLAALRSYQSGRRARHGAVFEVNQRIVDALDEAFYSSFGSIAPSGKRILIGVDVSGSMAAPGSAGASSLTAREAAAALAMCVVRRETDYHVFGFSSRFVELRISPKMRLDEVLRVTGSLPFEATDCSLPMLHALDRQIDVDAFHVYTDNETYFGKVHPVQALAQYRRKRGRRAKLAVAAFTPTKFSIADPNDLDMLDVAGLDSNTPQILASFSRDYAA